MFSWVSRMQTGVRRQSLRRPNSLNGPYLESGRQVLWEDGERILCREWRRSDDDSPRAVLTVLTSAYHPSRSSLDRLTREYELRDELDRAWPAQPLELLQDGGRAMLVLEDADGEPLERLIGAPMDTGRFLRLAIGIVAALRKAHQRGLVHKDIKPANILVNGKTGEVRLTGFGIASQGGAGLRCGRCRSRRTDHRPNPGSNQENAATNGSF